MNHIICAGTEFTGTNATTQGLVLGSCPGEIFFEARGLNTTEEWRLKYNRLFQRGDYKMKGHKTENCPGFVSR
jgi:hypothetical protein